MTYDMQYFTRNRKLKLEEYDDEGNLIETLELNPDLLTFISYANSGAFIDDRIIERKKDREYFGEDYDIAKETLRRLHSTELTQNRCLNPKNIKLIESIFNKYGLNVIKFVLQFSDGNDFKYDFTMEDYWEKKKENFINKLEWVSYSTGIWYAIDDKGNKGMAYLKEPTKKQAKYQRTKNGKRIVFLSFKDWKEHLVLEDELK
ncbi:hypothetical protein NSA42_03020 [Paeniclostridium sordellii]|uniref:hypothetical protein n=1 Tax=Paraclostridium sordellii TaxID=1505 RepID=UPI002149A32F|nr:hypothetical protein [Paeniclostridium sordellii]MCR1848240.1 hypothetical protein [Paeniclostridium sordellii]